MSNLFFLAQTAAESAEGGMSSVMNNGLTIAERLKLGLQVTGLGLGIVFSILILLWGILVLFRVVLYDIPNKRKETATTELPPVELPTPTEEILPNSQDQDDTAIVAAISAALAVVLEKPVTSFRVVSFKRVHKNSTWNQK